MNREEIIQSDQQYFMNVYSGRYPLVFERGEGIKVYDQNDSVYYDFLAGLGVNALGHCHPRLVTALEEQIKQVIHCSNLYYTEAQAELEKILATNSCADQVFFCNSGAEANEGAIKLARRYFTGKGIKRYEIITAKRSFHGRTLATLAATGQEKYQKHFQPLPTGFKQIAYNDLAAAQAAIGAKTAAIMVEPIQGEGGVYPADNSYLRGLRELCDQAGLLLIFDEIQCGLGRTGRLFAYQDYRVEPDIFTLAKALGGGVPIGAFLAKKEVASAFRPGDHGTTFGGNPLACRAACATLGVLLEEGFLERVQRVGAYFKARLADLGLNAPLQEVRGKGLMLAAQLGENRSAPAVAKEMFKRGYLINAVTDNTLRFLPPLIIGEDEIGGMINVLSEVLADF